MEVRGNDAFLENKCSIVLRRRVFKDEEKKWSNLILRSIHGVKSEIPASCYRKNPMEGVFKISNLLTTNFLDKLI